MNRTGRRTTVIALAETGFTRAEIVAHTMMNLMAFGLGVIALGLFAAEVEGLTITRVSGHGGERTVLESYRGQPLGYEFHDRIRFDIAVNPIQLSQKK